MGKIKTVIMGDEQVELEAREKAKAKREAKSAQGRSASGGKVLKKEGPKEKIESKEEIKTEVKKKVKKPENRYLFTRGKKYLEVKSFVNKNQKYSLPEAISLVKKTSYSAFDGTVEAHFNVTEKGARGIVSLPHGTGRQIRVKIADEALIADLEKGGKIDFDILVSSPDLMPKLAKVAKILGPRGLMPNPKTGTIGPDLERLALSLSKGQIQWKTEATAPIVHTVIGKVSFESKKLEENFTTLTKSIGKDKILSVFIKATMGPSVEVLRP